MTSEVESIGPRRATAIEAACRAILDRIAASRLAATALLLALVLATNLPGVLRLPPVDRTEVVYAETSREMLRDGRLIDPRYLGNRERHRPVGTFWLQMASVKLAGPGAADSIAAYRLPSLAGVALAVLAVFWLLAPVTGGRVALGAAALTAVTPIASLQAHLAITEGVTFGWAVLAELALLRIYVAEAGVPTRGLALLMWAALGVAITLNALAVPILCVATLVALYTLDRELGWLKRLHAGWGLPVMIALGSPWIVALVMAEGGWPFAGMSLNEILDLLGGSQAMKLRAWPGTFTLGFIVGFLPGVLLLWPALRRLWRGRADDRLPRFLFAWIAGYLVYLELISSKPALYTVQVMLPAAAAAVMLLLSPERAAAMRFPGSVAGWPGLAFAALYPVLVVVLHRLTHTPLTAGMIAGALTVAVLLALPALAAQARLATAWLVTTVAGFAAFLAFTFAVLLPSQKSAWTTEVLAEAVRPLKSCGDVAIVGYREPSAVFTFGARNVFLSPADLKASKRAPRYVVAEEASTGGLQVSGNTPGYCAEAFNVTRGCVQRFTVLETVANGGGACRMQDSYRCDAQNAALSGAKRCR
jgi:4-amino-4-deoxy-L-arabinose transferase-like glycosyltransferase